MPITKLTHSWNHTSESKSILQEKMAMSKPFWVVGDTCETSIRKTVLSRAAERNAVNAPIQGSAADIKIAMLRIHEKLKDYDSQMLLQVHDELVFDAKKSELYALTNMIKTEMEQAYNPSSLVVDVGTGTNWLEAHWFW